MLATPESDVTLGPVLVIANPASIRRAGDLAWARIERRLSECGVQFEVASSPAPGECAELARRGLLAGYQTIVVAGGDGTINQVVNGFYAGGSPINQAARLGIIPLGTGNDFARSLGLPRGEKSISSLLKSPRAVDVGLATLDSTGGTAVSRYFLNVAATGLPVQVVQRIPRHMSHGSGLLAYLVASLSCLRHASAAEMQITTDDTGTAILRLFALGVSNGPYFGGGMRLNPRGRLDDGRFEVISLKQTSLPRLALGLLAVCLGAHGALPEVNAWQATSLTLRSTAPFGVMLDGDALDLAATSLRVTILPQALLVLA